MASAELKAAPFGAAFCTSGANRSVPVREWLVEMSFQRGPKYTCQPEDLAVVSELPIKAADAGHPDMGRASSPPSKEIAGQFNS